MVWEEWVSAALTRMGLSWRNCAFRWMVGCDIGQVRQGRLVLRSVRNPSLSAGRPSDACLRNLPLMSEVRRLLVLQAEGVIAVSTWLRPSHRGSVLEEQLRAAWRREAKDCHRGSTQHSTRLQLQLVEASHHTSAE